MTLFLASVLGQKVCEAAQIELLGVAVQEDVSSCLSCHSLGVIRACLGTGCFWRAAQEQIALSSSCLRGQT